MNKIITPILVVAGLSLSGSSLGQHQAGVSFALEGDRPITEMKSIKKKDKPVLKQALKKKIRKEEIKQATKRKHSISSLRNGKKPDITHEVKQEEGWEHPAGLPEVPPQIPAPTSFNRLPPHERRIGGGSGKTGPGKGGSKRKLTGPPKHPGQQGTTIDRSTQDNKAMGKRYNMGGKHTGRKKR